MAVWKGIIAGCRVWINEVDHHPPHCHTHVAGKELKVDLFTLDIINPPPHSLPSKLRRGIKEKQDELLDAWEDVEQNP